MGSFDEIAGVMFIPSALCVAAQTTACSSRTLLIVILPTIEFEPAGNFLKSF
jgi:hypothetical protein